MPGLVCRPTKTGDGTNYSSVFKAFKRNGQKTGKFLRLQNEKCVVSDLRLLHSALHFLFLRGMCVFEGTKCSGFGWPLKFEDD